MSYIEKVSVGGTQYNFLDKNIASIETTSTASKAYAAGEYLVVGGQLCKATAAIAQNDSLVLNTNIESTLVGEELQSLSNEIVPVSDAWDVGVVYAVDDICIYNNTLYKCILAHTSSLSILPTDTTYWTETSVGGELSSLNSNYAKEKPRLLHSINSANNTWTYIFEQCLTWITLNVDTMLIPRVFVVLDNRIYRINAYYQNNMLGLSAVFNYVGSFALLACSCTYNTQTKKVTNSAFLEIYSSTNIETSSFDEHRYTGEVYIYI